VGVTRVLMCRPSHFDVEYVINPHMKPYTVKPARALQQWEALESTLESLGITVDVVDQPPGVPDMVFATDQAIVRSGTAVLANFRFPQRRKETPHYRRWFREHGFETIDLTKVFSFEGGDCLPLGDAYLVGTGFRANVGSCEELAQTLNTDVIPLRLVDPAFYHLDMALLPLDAETAFYYPPAFSDNSRHLLQKLVPHLHELSRDEAQGYAANSFVTDGTVVVQSGIPGFAARLKKLRFNVIETDLSEFKKAGGGIHCLINTLERT
jgi:N-dimethylarginine dimethylaminohydrolase